MASLRAFLYLAVCLLLGHQTFAKSNTPCQLSQWNNGFNTFLKRHLPSGTPTSLDQNKWKEYIKNLGSCSRPTQSFLPPQELERVKAVCTKRGGKVYKENMCISEQPFTFVTVRSEMGTCEIKNVRKETKHLILACEQLENVCVPIHFEGNPDNLKPSNNAKDCQDPGISDASSLRPTWLWLALFVVPIIINGC